jgi:hypothetical protein
MLPQQELKGKEMKRKDAANMQVYSCPSTPQYPVLVNFFPWLVQQVRFYRFYDEETHHPPRPELRNHIVLLPSKYLPNEFAQRFSKNVYFLWPGALQDVAIKDLQTGVHEFSTLFSSHYVNHCCWTLCIDFSVNYPELMGLFPIYNPLSTSLSVDPGPQKDGSAKENDFGICDRPIDESKFLGTGWIS